MMLSWLANPVANGQVVEQRKVTASGCVIS